MFYEVAKPDNHDCSFCRKITIYNFWWDIVQNEKGSNVWILPNKFQHIYCRSIESSTNRTAFQKDRISNNNAFWYFSVFSMILNTDNISVICNLAYFADSQMQI